MASPSVTYAFANATTADASQVNTNFSDIIAALTDGSKDLSFSALTAAGTATLNGAVNIGNGTSKDISFLGSLATSIPIKTTNSYDFGSATIGLRSIYLGDAGSAARSTRVIGATVASSWTMTLPTGTGSARAKFQTDGTGVTSWVSDTAMKVTTFTAGGTFSKTGNPIAIEVYLIGAGGAGGGSGTAAGANGGAGDATATFSDGTVTLSAGPGGGGGKWSSNIGGTGGTASISGAGATGIARTGAAGTAGGFSGTSGIYVLGGTGGVSPFGGAGNGNFGIGGSAVNNTGSGGGGGGTSGGVANTGAGGGGGAGGFVHAWITPVSSSYTVVGANGGANTSTGGTNGFASGSGSDFICVVIEHYQ